MCGLVQLDGILKLRLVHHLYVVLLLYLLLFGGFNELRPPHCKCSWKCCINTEQSIPAESIRELCIVDVCCLCLLCGFSRVNALLRDEMSERECA